MDDAEVVPMWPVGASEEYIAARLELARAERVLRDQVEAVAAARRALPEGTLVEDYVLAEGPADPGVDGPVRSTRLSELFGGHSTLVVYHLMFAPEDSEACPMCSMWVDGFNGVAAHLTQHFGFAVVAKAPLPKLRAWAARRGWDRVRVLSSHGTTFGTDLRAEHADGAQRPMVSVFVRDGGAVRHFYTLPANLIDNTERGIDLLSPVWNLLDLLPAGRGSWYAGNDYVRDASD
ncbi:DUF899 family protein [Phytohabitans houttuyneae]|uniref:Thioredoxin domain-containing protein n=1 Tax=Phytohabitans houttuyneae TaxID=1076126 RepID=A0A6V8JZW1_9ACTN|nr:DUF899 family protein [Phytohabitans houttuyneae]GFJ76864.1 hypothetical protein Phou_010440 [Phytohabitans houttuyneae]